MINLETPKKFEQRIAQAQHVAREVFRPISRKYDLAEHEYPKELDMLASLIDGLNEGGAGEGAGAASARRKARAERDGENRNGSNLLTVLSVIELCWGDVGLLLSMPRQGLGNSAIASVANDEQLARYGGRWAAMAITEPEAGSDSAAIRTTAVLDGEEYVLNGEKIFVTAGERAELVVVWATLDRARGRAAIRSFVVERSNPGLRLERLDHKLGIRASDTATFRLEDCRVPKDALLGGAEKAEQDVKQGFGGAMQTFDNTRPLVAAMAVGVARASLDETREKLAEVGVEVGYARPALAQSAAAARLLELEAEYEAARLLTLHAAWMADNGRPNSLQASLAKAKAGRMSVDVTLACVELCGSIGYSEQELLEKWARDAKILDIFEGTQQIQLLIVARTLLGRNSAQLK
ncbi:MAG: acyl-CoA dehydrogenase family protein [Solirubrobacterales bacterium]